MVLVAEFVDISIRVFLGTLRETISSGKIHKAACSRNVNHIQMSRNESSFMSCNSGTLSSKYISDSTGRLNVFCFIVVPAVEINVLSSGWSSNFIRFGIGKRSPESKNSHSFLQFRWTYFGMAKRVAPWDVEMLIVWICNFLADDLYCLNSFLTNRPFLDW